MSRPNDNDDTKDSLLEIAQRHAVPIISLLLECQDATVKPAKYTKYIERLSVFSPGTTKRTRAPGGECSKRYLNHRPIDANEDRNYVAVSYTWRPAEDEIDDEAQPRTYLIQRGQTGHYEDSPVRDATFMRSIRYMRNVRAGSFWLDQHSIEQETECKEHNCGHMSCIKKKEAIFAADLVYRQSSYPVRLLRRVMTSALELRLLCDLLENKLTRVEHFQDGPFFSVVPEKQRDAESTLQLLTYIARDLWWTRAWTYQEHYRGGSRMELLMRHKPSLEAEKRRLNVFGCIEGELQFGFSDFSTRATMLCLALSSRFPNRRTGGEREESIKSMLAALGRYAVLLDESQAMSATIIADVNARGLQNPSDRLDIVANCCQYSLRVDWQKLRHSDHHGASLSAALMAQYLINGEIMYNGEYSKRYARNIATLPVDQALRCLSFDMFQAPLEEAGRSWSHNKRCRFFEPVMTETGVKTKGHLWELGTTIHTAGVRWTESWVNDPRADLTLECCRTLMWLSYELESRNCRELPEELRQFVQAGYEQGKFSDAYMCTMAMEVCDAIKEGKRLTLGRLWQRDEFPVAYSAIFILDDQV